jgi:uncharacterized membrane protein
MSTQYAHPQPVRYRQTQYLTAVLLGIIVLAAPLQVVLGLLIQGAVLFFITAILTLLLALPLVMYTTATPPVTVSKQGITVQPALWREQTIAWAGVQMVKPYPLLPTADAEVVRKALIGRKTYRSAAGLMLIIPALPPIYRVTGWFAGEGFTPVIAFTNRSHTNYEHLAKQVLAHCPYENGETV